MDAGHRRPAGLLWPTVDLLLAGLGLWIVSYPLVVSLLSTVDGVILSPAGLTVLVALVGSYPFVAGHWSLGTLGDYVCCWTGALFALAIGAFPVALAVGGVPEGLWPAARTTLFVVAHLVALAGVGLYGLSPTRRF